MESAVEIWAPPGAFLVTVFVSHSFSCFIDLKLDNIIIMAPRMVSFDFYKLSGKIIFVDFQKGEKDF